MTASTLLITSPAFSDQGKIPIRYTGFGEDISPELRLRGLDPAVVSLAIIMDDLDNPIRENFDHWTIWNLPAKDTIPEGIPHGAEVPSLGASQGISYGKHRYRGPKPPFFIHSAHRYCFYVYGLDCQLALTSDARRQDLVSAMEGHILQTGCITGTYRHGE